MKTAGSLGRSMLVLLACLALPLSFTACDDDEDGGSHHEHAEADGLILRISSNAVVEIDGDVVTGSIATTAGGTTGTIVVTFVDEDGDEFTPDEDMSIDLEVANSGVATTTVTGDWSFQVNGVTAGATTVAVSIIHEGHSDYTSPAIPVEVAAP